MIIDKPSEVADLEDIVQMHHAFNHLMSRKDRAPSKVGVEIKPLVCVPIL